VERECTINFFYHFSYFINVLFFIFLTFSSLLSSLIYQISFYYSSISLSIWSQSNQKNKVSQSNESDQWSKSVLGRETHPHPKKNCACYASFSFFFHFLIYYSLRDIHFLYDKLLKHFLKTNYICILFSQL